jgi:putative effector of murein hydrolase
MGMTSASLLIVLFVGTVVGAVTGLVVGSSFGADYLAVLAGFLGAIVAAIARDFIIARGAGVGPDDTHRTPALVLVYAIIASLAGSLAAKEVSDFSEITAPVGIGALAGLFSGVLLAMLMITYHTHPGHPPRLKKRS